MPEPAPAVRLRPAVQLSKAEAFDACQALADAHRCLLRSHDAGEADALARLFELLESRLCAEREPVGRDEGVTHYACSEAAFSSSGS